MEDGEIIARLADHGIGRVPCGNLRINAMPAYKGQQAKKKSIKYLHFLPCSEACFCYTSSCLDPVDTKGKERV
jgi:hypothetical protein